MGNSVPRLAVFGDSLTEGYGLRKRDALPAVLEALLRESGTDVEALNFGVSGETAHDGLRRVDTVLAAEPDAVIIEFGANDFFIGDPVSQVRDTIASLIQAFVDKNIPVLLVGIKTTSDIPQSYRHEFDPIFQELATSFDVPLYPDILRPYFGKPMLTLMDGLHPNEEGVRSMASALLPQVKALLSGS